MIFRLGVGVSSTTGSIKANVCNLKIAKKRMDRAFFWGVVTCVRSRLHTMNWSINPDTERTKTFGLGFEQISS